MTRTKKFTYIIAAIVAAIAFILSSFVVGSGVVAHAATSARTEFESTNVMDDLKTATINGKAFDVVNYPYDSTGIFKHPEIMTVVEYCYSFRPGQRDNYGLYIYFYNPQALNISTASKANKILLGVKYGTDSNGNIKVEDYEKFDLQFCSKSTGDYRDLFYKFKVIDHKSDYDGQSIAERVNSNSRRYDIIEVELLTYGELNATAYSVGGSYTFTGYASGYGADLNAESTLACKREDLETITLDLAGVMDGVDKRTYWRSNSVSSLGKGHQNQINSVFFAIDNSVLEKYGYTLQRIKAEWYEYKTRPAVLIEDKSVYEGLMKWRGVEINDCDESRGYSITAEGSMSSSGYAVQYDYSYSWNHFLGKYKAGNTTFTISSDYDDKLLPLLFYTRGLAVENYNLTATIIQQYCEDYSASFNSGHITFGGHDFSADLFDDCVDEGRTLGYNLHEFDITNPDDYFNLKSYDSTHNWWDKFRDYGFGQINTSDEYLDVSPIEMVTDEYIASSNLSNDLKINPDDVTRFKDFYNSSVKLDKTVFIFHYAFTDYFAAPLGVYDKIGKADDYTVNKLSNGEVRQGTQIMAFDILTMTFNKNGDLYTMGVVSSPVDHFAGYSPALRAQYSSWWEWIIALVSLVVFIVILILLWPIISPFISWLVNGIIWLVTAPFKAIAALFEQKKE